MQLAEFEILETKVAALLQLHRELTIENRRLRGKLEEGNREIAALRAERLRTGELKSEILDRIDKVMDELSHE